MDTLSSILWTELMLQNKFGANKLMYKKKYTHMAAGTNQTD